MEDLGISLGQRMGAIQAWLASPITQLLMIPLLGALLISLTPRKNERVIRFLAVVATSIPVLIVLSLLLGWGQTPFSPAAGFQYGLPEASYRWVAIQFGEYQSFAVSYSVGLDGLSMPLVALTTAMMLLCALWALPRRERVREYFALFLVLETALIGIFVALDFVLFYLFWELMLIPMFFLIAGWGKHPERASRAAIKFFIYTMTGSVFYLIAFIALKIYTDSYSFSMLEIQQAVLGQQIAYLPMEYRALIFAGLALAFLVKAPIFPFHTWLPDAHTEAPPEISAVLAAIMLKTGAYGLIRVAYASMPDVAYLFGPLIGTLAVIAIVYGAAVTLAQTNFKRMVAFSSISHMGFILLGISAMNLDALVGAVFHMVGHGVIIGSLFLLSGVIEQRYGTLDLRELSGLSRTSPAYATVLTIGAFAAMGFPLLIGFWGEFLVLRGTFFNNPVWEQVSVGTITAATYFQWLAVIAVLGILISAVYMLNMLYRVLFVRHDMPVLVPDEQPATAAAEVVTASVHVEFVEPPVLNVNGHPIQPWRGFRLNHALALLPLSIAMVLFFWWPGPIFNCVQVVAGSMYLIFLGS